MAVKPKKARKKPSRNGTDGRNSKGQFVKGNKGGPGHPYGKRIAELRKAMLEAVTEEDIQAIIDRMVSLAKTGKDSVAVKAASLVLDRVLGKPKEAPEPEEAKEGQEWREVYMPELGYVIRVPMNADLAAVVEAVKG